MQKRKITDFTILQSMNSTQIVFDAQYTIQIPSDFCI